MARKYHSAPRIRGTGRVALFDTRDVHPRGLARRWVVYWRGEPVCVKRTTHHFVNTPQYRGIGSTDIEAEFVLLTPVARWLGGDPNAVQPLTGK